MEHYIELIYGTRIEAFPKAVQPETIKEDKFVLDTTGEYLQFGRGGALLVSPLACRLSPRDDA